MITGSASEILKRKGNNLAYMKNCSWGNSLYNTPQIEASICIWGTVQRSVWLQHQVQKEAQKIKLGKERERLGHTKPWRDFIFILWPLISSLHFLSSTVKIQFHILKKKFQKRKFTQRKLQAWSWICWVWCFLEIRKW